MSRIKDMTTGSITKHILTFAFPLIISSIGQQLYMIADTSIVGLGVGIKALAAVGATDWIYWLILFTIIGFTQGFSTFTERYFGEKNYEKVNKSIAMSALLSLFVGIVVTVFGLLCAKPLLSFMNTPPDILRNATIYITTMISGTLIITAYNMAASILRAFGDGKSPLIAMVIAAILNVLLDLIFVLLFKWGIFGAAIASVISQGVSFVYCFIQIKRIEIVRLTKESFSIDFKEIAQMFKFGVPIAFQHIIINISGIILQSTINLQGSIFIAGYTATNKLYGLLECSAAAIGITLTTFVAQNYGANNLKRVRKGVLISGIFSVFMATFIAIIMILFGKYFLMLFIKAQENGAQEALRVAHRYLIIMTSSLIVLYLIYIYRNTLQAMQISVWSMFSGFTECIVRIFMAKKMIHIIGTDAIFLSEPLAWAAALAGIYIPYLFYKRKLLH